MELRAHPPRLISIVASFALAIGACDGADEVPSTSAGASPSPVAEVETEVREPEPEEAPALPSWYVRREGEGDAARWVVFGGSRRWELPPEVNGEPRAVRLFSLRTDGDRPAVAFVWPGRVALFELVFDPVGARPLFDESDERRQLRVRMHDLDADGVRELVLFRVRPHRQEVDIFLPGYTRREAYRLVDESYEQDAALRSRMSSGPDPDRDSLSRAVNEATDGVFGLWKVRDLESSELRLDAMMEWRPATYGELGSIGAFSLADPEISRPSDFAVGRRFVVLGHRHEGDEAASAVAAVAAIVEVDAETMEVLATVEAGPSRNESPARLRCTSRTIPHFDAQVRAVAADRDVRRIRFAFPLAGGRYGGRELLWDGESLLAEGDVLELGECERIAPAPATEN